ncbi:MAG TPA: hypothetical protein VGK73_16090 [Polyangiaceae bacterium]
MTRPGATPWRDQPWSLTYQFGMLLAVLYESRGHGEHHRVDPYMNVQAAHEGDACCECVACREDRS